MTQRLIALFDEFENARDAIEGLVDNGFRRENISLIASNTDNRYNTYLSEFNPNNVYVRPEVSDDVKGGEGAAFGAVVGTLVGLGVALIPGIGPVIAAGPFAAALMAGIGAATGAATGGLTASMVNFGVTEDEARAYSAIVQRGGTLVVVDAADVDADLAEDTLESYDPVDIRERVTNAVSTPVAETSSANAAQYAAVPAADSFGARDSVRVGRHMVERQMFDDYRDDFRQHYDASYVNSGYTYDEYLPAYRYGYYLATDNRYRDYTWEQLEPTARTYWEEQNVGPWERFKDAVQNAWMRVTERR